MNKIASFTKTAISASLKRDAAIMSGLALSGGAALGGLGTMGEAERFRDATGKKLMAQKDLPFASRHPYVAGAVSAGLWPFVSNAKYTHKVYTNLPKSRVHKMEKKYKHELEMLRGLTDFPKHPDGGAAQRAQDYQLAMIIKGPPK